MAKLKDLANVIRSKNAGAFQLTLDVMFVDPELYAKVKRSGVLNRELFARLYKARVEDVIFAEYDAAYAFKATMPRPVPSGHFGDTDLLGSQQHSLLFEVEIPID